MRISDWSSDGCSSDLGAKVREHPVFHADDEHRRELEALGSVDRHEHHLARVAVDLVGVGHQAHLLEERLDRLGLLRRAHQLRQVLEATLALDGALGAQLDRKSTRLNSSPYCASRMPSSA